MVPQTKEVAAAAFEAFIRRGPGFSKEDYYDPTADPGWMDAEMERQHNRNIQRWRSDTRRLAHNGKMALKQLDIFNERPYDPALLERAMLTLQAPLSFDADGNLQIENDPDKKYRMWVGEVLKRYNYWTRDHR